MDDAGGDGVTTQGDVNGGGLVGDRLQLGDDLADRAGVFIIDGQELRGFLFVRLPASFCMGAKRGVGGSLRSGLFRSEHGGEFGVQVRNARVESIDCTLAGGAALLDHLMLRVTQEHDAGTCRRKLGMKREDLTFPSLNLGLDHVGSDSRLTAQQFVDDSHDNLFFLSGIERREGALIVGAGHAFSPGTPEMLRWL